MCLLSVVSLLAVAGLARGSYYPGFNTGYGSGGYGGGGYGSFQNMMAVQMMEARVRNLEIAQARDDDDDDLIDIINKLARQSCQIGRGKQTLCPGGFDSPLNQVADCVNVFNSGNLTGPRIVDIPITFSPRFDRPPALRAAFSGFAIYQGANLSIEVTSVTRRGANLQFMADDFVPVAVDITWFACPPPAIDNDDDDFRVALSRNAGARPAMGFPSYDPRLFAAPNSANNVYLNGRVNGRRRR